VGHQACHPLTDVGHHSGHGEQEQRRCEGGGEKGVLPEGGDFRGVVVRMAVFGLVLWEDMNSNVNWGVILLYGAAISLGIQMTESGAALWVADRMLSFLNLIDADTGVPLWISISAFTTGVTNTMSNGAAVAVLGPINLNLANAAGESPLLVGFITSISSAFAYLTVIGTPACTIVYASGYLKPKHFLKAGFRTIMISITVLVLAAYFYWPLLGL